MIDFSDRDVWLSALGALVALWSVCLVVYVVVTGSKGVDFKFRANVPAKVDTTSASRAVWLANGWMSVALFGVAGFLLLSGRPLSLAIVALSGATISGLLARLRW